jgi:protoporphyrinogen oxidase
MKSHMLKAQDLSRAAEVTPVRRASPQKVPAVCFDFAILGAGVSGMSAANTISDASSVVMIDEYAGMGGNHKSRTIGPYTFDIGSFVFKGSDELFKAFPELEKLCVPTPVNVQRIAPGGHVEKYPYSPRTELFRDGYVSGIGSLASVLISKIKYQKKSNAADYAKYYMGERIFKDSGLELYIERLLGSKAGEIEIEFAKRRMTWIARAGSIRQRARNLKIVAPTAGVQLVRPAQGFDKLYAPVKTALEKRGVQVLLGERIESVTRIDGVFHIRTNHRSIQARRIISTIPIQHAAPLFGALTEIEPLQNVDLVSLYFSFEGKRGFRDQILQNFADRGRWKRLTMHSDFYGTAQGREYFSVEVPAGDVSIDEIEADFRDSIASVGLFQGDLKLEGHDVTRFAYPVYRRGATATVARLVAELKALGVESLGRQGRFDYLPTGALTAKLARVGVQRMLETD